MITPPYPLARPLLQVTAMLLAAGALLLPAAAQDVSSYPTVMNPEKYTINWTDFYQQSDRRTAEVRRKLKHQLDLAYGTQPKQKLDLYVPRDADGDAPVLLFLHGGGFKEGDRSHYGFIAESFVNHGVVTAIASYRLALGDSHFPDQADDVKAALLWLHENVAQYGGDGQALYVSGHSAGAMLAANVAVDRGWLESAGVPREVLRGAIPISGAYDLRLTDRDYYTPTPELEVAASSILHVIDPAPHFLVVLGEEEPKYQAGSQELAQRLVYDGVTTRFMVMKGADHRETAEAFADERSDLFKASLDLINR